MNLSSRAKRIISSIPYMALASSDQFGNPWNAPVFCAFDSAYSFYWGTYRDSQKSKNVRANKNVFGVIFDSTVPAGQGEGVYFQAQAHEIADPRELQQAHQLLSERHVEPYWKIEEVQGDGPIRLYKAVPTSIWMNAGSEVDGIYIDTRESIDLHT